jgi:nitrogen fixation NifU-like protein
MNAPTASAFVHGLCGDDMEFYLVIEHERLSRVRFYTNGCEVTKACAAFVAAAVETRTLDQALAVSAGDVITGIRGLTGGDRHCAILAVTTLYRAIADYLLQP